MGLIIYIEYIPRNLAIVNSHVDKPVNVLIFSLEVETKHLRLCFRSIHLLLLDINT